MHCCWKPINMRWPQRRLWRLWLCLFPGVKYCHLTRLDHVGFQDAVHRQMNGDRDIRILYTYKLRMLSFCRPTGYHISSSPQQSFLSPRLLLVVSVHWVLTEPVLAFWVLWLRSVEGWRTASSPLLSGTLPLRLVVSWCLSQLLKRKEEESISYVVIHWSFTMNSTIFHSNDVVQH